MTHDIVVALLAVGLFTLAHWGRRHVEELVPTTLSAAGRDRKVRQYRRGAFTCQLVAVLLLVYALGRMIAGV